MALDKDNKGGIFGFGILRNRKEHYPGCRKENIEKDPERRLQLAREAIAKKDECDKLMADIKWNMENHPEIAYHQAVDLKYASQELAEILQKLSGAR